MKLDRILITAPSSGSGKTLVTCGLLGILKKRGLKTASFKCGPDFIDPMFHTKVIGTKSRNLDTFFAGDEVTRMLLRKNGADCDIAVMEGVMGYYDGLSENSSRAGASDLAQVTDTPVLLVVNAAAASRSILPLIKGFLDFQEKPCIKGVILNRISPMLYPRMKKVIEEELKVQVVGYLPVLKDCVLESRHLGLLMPDEIASVREKLELLSGELDHTLDVDAILEIAHGARELPEEADLKLPACRIPLKIGLARDEAFCFFYEDNLAMLREMGAELVEFSPVHDRELPEGLDGLLLHGGYPELYASALSENRSMLASIRKALEKGLPCMAECGGFLYLHEVLRDMEGREWPMVGAVPGKAYYTGRLTRFGYITLSEGKVFGREVGDIRSHEFHYFESEHAGEAFLASKPSGKRSWRCIRSGSSLFAGFPHLYYYANPEVPKAFLECCVERKSDV
ncbi:cobyrinate a,c-diamide synthase [Lachnospiraceae bacterium LCP19S3_B12]